MHQIEDLISARSEIFHYKDRIFKMIMKKIIRPALPVLTMMLAFPLQGSLTMANDKQPAALSEHKQKKQTQDFDSFGFNHFSEMQDKINDIIENFFSNRHRKAPLLSGTSSFISPLLNMSENDKGVEIKVELPGLGENDIRIESKNNQLIIRGERKEEKEEKDKNYYIHESFGGNFLRTITIPFDFDVSKTKATFKNGILDIFIEKPKESSLTTKTIPITPQ